MTYKIIEMPGPNGRVIRTLTTDDPNAKVQIVPSYRRSPETQKERQRRKWRQYSKTYRERNKQGLSAFTPEQQAIIVESLRETNRRRVEQYRALRRGSTEHERLLARDRARRYRDRKRMGGVKPRDKETSRKSGNVT